MSLGGTYIQLLVAGNKHLCSGRLKIKEFCILRRCEGENQSKILAYSTDIKAKNNINLFIYLFD
jgi:hypothetical protein